MTSEQRDYVAGLRQVADFIEAHPNLPLPIASPQSVYVFSRDRLIAAAREPGVRWQKHADADSDYFKLAVSFAGGHGFEVFIERSEVCRKVVTGTRVVPAKPEHEVETFQWVCDEPLLASAP